jgi:predicted AAA+ superfamily ATPase
LDTVKGDLFEIVKKINLELGRHIFLLDEIHFQSDFQEGLKKIYDFLDVKVVFTSSVSLVLFRSSYDLSRRVKLKKLYPFTFREYLFFKQGVVVPSITLADIFDKKWDKEHLSYADCFDDYLRGGIFPFSLEEPVPLPILKNILKTVVNRDIAKVGGVSMDELDIIERMVAFIAMAGVDKTNYSTLSRNLGITKYKARQYTELLEKAFVINQVFPKGANVLKEPKILMAVPCRLLWNDYQRAIGGLREDFFVETLRSMDMDCHYLKSRRGAKTPDYLVCCNDREVVVEIGGKGKGPEQFKGIKVRDKYILSHSLETRGIRRPLLLAGFLG